MSNGISKENILRALPDVLANDENMLALASVIADVLAARPDEIASLLIYSKIDELPMEQLDILAYDFKVDWWDYNYTLEEKRRTLKDSWNVHRTLGTKGAVEKAISAIYPETKVSEWFEYGGRKYYFKLLINLTQENKMDIVKQQRVFERVEYYKNLRSLVDSIDYFIASPENSQSFGAVAAAGVGGKITVEVNVNGLE